MLFCSCTADPNTSEAVTSGTEQQESSMVEESTANIPVTSMPVPQMTLDRIPNICTSRYGYYQLNADEKAVYDQIVSSARAFQSDVELCRKLSDIQVKRICHILYLEETELYYLTMGYQLRLNESTGIVSAVKLSYRYNSMTVSQINEELSDKVEEILSKITPGMSDIDKVKYFHDTIVLNCRYTDEGDYVSAPYGALVKGEALCEGYARAFAMLCNKVGIENLFATGTVGEEEHMWNMVKVDGAWYNIDVTWDDPAFTQNVKLDDGYIQYSYFLFPDRWLSAELVADKNLFDLPLAETFSANYYVYNNLYCYDYDEIKRKLSKAIYSAYENRTRFVSVRCVNAKLYNQAVEKLVQEKEIFSTELSPPELRKFVFMPHLGGNQIIQFELSYDE